MDFDIVKLGSAQSGFSIISVPIQHFRAVLSFHFCSIVGIDFVFRSLINMALHCIFQGVFDVDLGMSTVLGLPFLMDSLVAVLGCVGFDRSH